MKDGSIDLDVDNCRVLKGVGVLHDQDGHIGLKAVGREVEFLRPYEVAMLLEYSGSMNNESDLWNCESYLDNGSEATTLNGYDFPATTNPRSWQCDWNIWRAWRPSSTF